MLLVFIIISILTFAEAQNTSTHPNASNVTSATVTSIDNNSTLNMTMFNATLNVTTSTPPPSNSSSFSTNTSSNISNNTTYPASSLSTSVPHATNGGSDANHSSGSNQNDTGGTNQSSVSISLDVIISNASENASTWPVHSTTVVLRETNYTSSVISTATPLPITQTPKNGKEENFTHPILTPSRTLSALFGGGAETGARILWFLGMAGTICSAVFASPSIASRSVRVSFITEVARCHETFFYPSREHYPSGFELPFQVSMGGSFYAGSLFLSTFIFLFLPSILSVLVVELFKRQKLPARFVPKIREWQRKGLCVVHAICLAYFAGQVWKCLAMVGMHEASLAGAIVLVIFCLFMCFGVQYPIIVRLLRTRVPQWLLVTRRRVTSSGASEGEANETTNEMKPQEGNKENKNDIGKKAEGGEKNSEEKKPPDATMGESSVIQITDLPSSSPVAALGKSSSESLNKKETEGGPEAGKGGDEKKVGEGDVQKKKADDEQQKKAKKKAEDDGSSSDSSAVHSSCSSNSSDTTSKIRKNKRKQQKKSTSISDQNSISSEEGETQKKKKASKKKAKEVVFVERPTEDHVFQYHNLDYTTGAFLRGGSSIAPLPHSGYLEFESYGIFIEHSRAPDFFFLRNYFLEELAVNCAAGFLSAFHAEKDSCPVLAGTMTGLMAGHTALILYIRPFYSKSENIFSILSSTVMSLLAFVGFIATFLNVESGEISDALQMVHAFMGLLLLTLVIIFLVHGGCSVFLYLKEKRELLLQQSKMTRARKILLLRKTEYWKAGESLKEEKWLPWHSRKQEDVPSEVTAPIPRSCVIPEVRSTTRSEGNTAGGETLSQPFLSLDDDDAHNDLNEDELNADGSVKTKKTVQRIVRVTTAQSPSSMNDAKKAMQKKSPHAHGSVAVPTSVHGEIHDAQRNNRKEEKHDPDQKGFYDNERIEDFDEGGEKIKALIVPEMKPYWAQTELGKLLHHIEEKKAEAEETYHSRVIIKPDQREQVKVRELGLTDPKAWLDIELDKLKNKKEVSTMINNSAMQQPMRANNDVLVVPSLTSGGSNNPLDSFSSKNSESFNLNHRAVSGENDEIEDYFEKCEAKFKEKKIIKPSNNKDNIPYSRRQQGDDGLQRISSNYTEDRILAEQYRKYGIHQPSVEQRQRTETLVAQAQHYLDEMERLEQEEWKRQLEAAEEKEKKEKQQNGAARGGSELRAAPMPQPKKGTALVGGQYGSTLSGERNVFKGLGAKMPVSKPKTLWDDDPDL